MSPAGLLRWTRRQLMQPSSQQQGSSYSRWIHQYRYPPPARSRGDGDEAMWGLIAANGIVFLCWRTMDPIMMRRHFTVSEESVYNGRFHTIITAAFSHYDLTHFGSNMLALYFFGRDIAQVFGGAYLINLYVVGRGPQPTLIGHDKG